MKSSPKESPARLKLWAIVKELRSKHGKAKPPTFHDLWGKANQAITDLIEAYPKQFWEHAAKTHRIPLLMPRQRTEHKEFMNLLKNKGIILKGRGKTRELGSTINNEVEAAYTKVQNERLELGMMKFKGAKLPPLLAEVESLPALRSKTLKPLWMHWLLEAFLDTHNGEPEKSRQLLDLVEVRVNKSGVSPTQRAFRNEIKKDFKKAVSRFAKEQSDLLGD